MPHLFSAPLVLEPPTGERHTTVKATDKQISFSYLLSGTNLKSVVWWKDENVISENDMHQIQPIRNVTKVTGHFSYGQKTAMKIVLDVDVEQEDTCDSVGRYGGVYHLEASGATNNLTTPGLTVYCK